MKKVSLSLKALFIIALIFFTIPNTVSAQTQTYIVKPGDSMWKIAVKYQVGLSEIIAANPQIKNPALIYPNQKITIPTTPAVTSLEKEVARLVNVQRSNYGLPALSYNWQLARVARYKSEDMRDRNYFSHTSPTYGSPFTMIKAFKINFSAAGENIAKGQKTPQQVMNGWMNSAGHRQNILSKNYTQIGVGYAKDRMGTTYWTQMFIRP